jgi:formyl-CoA transferase
MAKPVKHYALGEINLVAQGVKLTRTPSEFRNAAPDRGAQSEEILQEHGFSAQDIAGFRERGVV